MYACQPATLLCPGAQRQNGKLESGAGRVARSHFLGKHVRPPYQKSHLSTLLSHNLFVCQTVKNYPFRHQFIHLTYPFHILGNLDTQLGELSNSVRLGKLAFHSIFRTNILTQEMYECPPPPPHIIPDSS